MCSQVAKSTSSIDFDDIVENQGWLRSLAVALAGDPVHADDLVQDTWEAAGSHTAPPREERPAWLGGILRNRWRQAARARNRRVRREADAASEVGDTRTAEQLCERAELYGILCQLVGALDEPYRTTVLLRYAEDLSSQEIAERLDIAPSTVRVRLHRALAQLREGIEGQMGERRAWTILGGFLAKGVAVKTGGKGILLAILALLLLLGGGTAWKIFGARSGENVAGGDDVPASRGAGARPGVAREGAALPAWFGAPNRAERRIAGVVTFQNEPFAGARVSLTSNATRAAVVEPVVLTTSATGTFDFGAQRAAVYDVTASAQGRGYGHARVDTRDPSRDSEGIEVQLSGCEHSLYGVVRDASSGTIEGAQIVPTTGRFQETTSLDAAATSDPDGRYELCTPAGEQSVVVLAEGYGALTLTETVVGRRRCDMQLIPEAVVVGRAVHADTEEPVAGALVRLYPGVWPGPVRSTNDTSVTGADGSFRIAGLAPGRHVVTAETDTLYGPPVPVLVDAGRESRQVILRLQPTATVRGKVTHDGEPLAAARVSAAIYGMRPGDLAVTDSDGAFELTKIRPGRIGFLVAGWKVLSPASLDVTLSGKNSVTVEVARLGVIKGQVLFRGQPVPGADVNAQVKTDAAGRFELTGLAAGEHVVYAQSESLQAFTTEKTFKKISLAQGEVRDNVILELDGSASIEGIVVDQDGAAVPGVFVQYTHDVTGDLCRSTTGEDGRFVCGMLSGGGAYVPTVRADRSSSIHFSPAADDSLAPVEVPDADSKIRSQRLRIRASKAVISGRVVTQTGEPYPDVAVRVSESASGRTPMNAPWVGFPVAITDTEGSFSIQVWGDSTYGLYARAPGGGDAHLSGVKAGTSDVVIHLHEPGRVTGKLVGFREQPMVFVRRIGDTTEAFRAAVEGASFDAPGIPPGRYAVIASVGADGAAESVQVEAGVETTVTLRAREHAQLEGRVVDFVTGEPVPKAACRAAPYEPGAPMFWGPPPPALSDADGRFRLEAPSGHIQVYCSAQAYSDGVARAMAKAGQTTTLEVPVVAADLTAGLNSIGARFLVGSEVHAVVQLRPGGAAEAAGVRVGDAITAIDGRDVTVLTTFGLNFFIGRYEIGTELQVTVQRSGKAATLKLHVEKPWWE